MQTFHNAKAFVSYIFPVVFSGIIEFGVQRPSTKVYQDVKHVPRSTRIKNRIVIPSSKTKKRLTLIKANGILFRTRRVTLLLLYRYLGLRN